VSQTVGEQIIGITEVFAIGWFGADFGAAPQIAAAWVFSDNQVLHQKHQSIADKHRQTKTQRQAKDNQNNWPCVFENCECFFHLNLQATV